MASDNYFLDEKLGLLGFDNDNKDENYLVIKNYEL
jgi:hypothetical protein